MFTAIPKCTCGVLKTQQSVQIGFIKAVTTTFVSSDGEKPVETAAILDGSKRSIRSKPIQDTGHRIRIPMGAETRRRIINMIGEPINETGSNFLAPRSKGKRMEGRRYYSSESSRGLDSFKTLLSQITSPELRSKLEGQIEAVLEQLQDVNAEKQLATQRAHSAEKELEMRDMAMRTVVEFRTAAEELEKIIFPVFIQEADLSRFQKWIVVLSLDVNMYARFIHKELESRGLKVYEFAYTLHKCCDQQFGKFCHNQNRSQVPTTEEGWNEVYRLLHTYHYHERESVKLTFLSLPLIGKLETSEKKYEYFILFWNARSKIDPTKVKEAFERIEGFEKSWAVIVRKDVNSTRSGYTACRVKFSKPILNWSWTLRRKVRETFYASKVLVCSLLDPTDVDVSGS